MGPQQSSNTCSPSYNFDIVTIRVISGPDCKRRVWTLTGMTQTGTIKFTWARPESMKRFHETGTRLQIGMNVYMKHGGSSYFSFVICFIVPFIVKCSTANKNTAESEEKRENYSISSRHKHSSFKRKDSQKQEEMVDCSRKDWLLVDENVEWRSVAFRMD